MPPDNPQAEPVECISAITLTTADMARSVAFYESLGLRRCAGGEDGVFTSLRAGTGYLNLQLADVPPLAPGAWGRVVLWIDDVDRMHRRCLDAGFTPLTSPADAPWGERYFHIRDPNGHELSFARPLRP